MQSIADWLAALGLGKYAAYFIENEVDWVVLPGLTDGELRQLGLPLGPRKTLLAAVAALEVKPARWQYFRAT